jgi:hypothetical protein
MHKANESSDSSRKIQKLSMQTQEIPKRYHGLDLVRAIAMMLGLVIHVSIFSWMVKATG